MVNIIWQRASDTKSCTGVYDASFDRLLGTMRDGTVKTNLEAVQQLAEYLKSMGLRTLMQNAPMTTTPAVVQPAKPVAKMDMDEMSNQCFGSLFEGSEDLLEYLSSRPGYQMADFIPVLRKDFDQQMFEPFKILMNQRRELIHNILQKLKSDYEAVERKEAEKKLNDQKKA